MQYAKHTIHEAPISVGPQSQFSALRRSENRSSRSFGIGLQAQKANASFAEPVNPVLAQTH